MFLKWGHHLTGVKQKASTPTKILAKWGLAEHEKNEKMLLELPVSVGKVIS